jgi:beta-galactosidase
MVPGKKFLISIILLTGYYFAGAQRSDNSMGMFFDDHWKFALGDNKAAVTKDFDDRDWRNVELPHDWSIEGAPDHRNPSKAAGGYFPTGIGWYRKKFIAPMRWAGKEITVLFEGVYMNAAVFINGHSLGVHPYGYSTFYYDITHWLVWGRQNIIAVRVDNSQQVNCRWYSGSGVYRHVRILAKDPMHIDPWGVAITTADAGADKAAIDIQAVVKNDSNLSGEAVLSTVIMDSADNVVGSDRVSLRLGGKGEDSVTRRISVARPLLWSVENPHLYRAKMTLNYGGKSKDKYVSTFGIRTIAFSPKNGFMLNGRPMKLYGGCIHHDNGCIGAVALGRAEERKIELLKRAGFNAIRTAHNPPSIALLDACDRLGMLVIDEAFDGWRQSKNTYDYSIFFDSWWRRDLTSMVLRDRNHPSVIIWSVGNEILERKSPEAIKMATRLVSLVHQYDTTRPVTSAMTTWDKDWEIFDPLFAVQDIGGYNYQLFRAASDHQRISIQGHCANRILPPGRFCELEHY